jgi:N-acetylglutamate synthase-like GNAT family acetyltransferase
VGAGALRWAHRRQLELTKMGVKSGVCGMKAAEFLHNALIERAATMMPERLFLLTSSACKAAIHLYQKPDFSMTQICWQKRSIMMIAATSI